MSSKVSKKNSKRNKKLAKNKKSIHNRLSKKQWKAQENPMFKGSNIHYEISEKIRALSVGGIGLMHKMVQKLGLDRTINEDLKILKVYIPYHESDHVLNLAYNILSGGTCIEDIELRRNDEVYLDALGAQRIPDPTTEGDFCRRFKMEDIETLQNVFNKIRLQVWSKQEESFFEKAYIDGDGTIAPTTGECKEGMDLSYKGLWGYHPLVISLANTAEPLFLVNRSGSRPSHEGAAERFDQAIGLCKQAGFKKIMLRGDSDFSQSAHLDRWNAQGVEFVFGMDSRKNLTDMADSLHESQWTSLQRMARYEVKTQERSKRENVQDKIVQKREYKKITLQSEHVAEFLYKPTKCKKAYRIVVARKNLSVEKGKKLLFDEIKYFFYITNDMNSSCEEIVFLSNDRCNQENLIEQLKNGVRSMSMPVDNLMSNWAYMVMASLAWNLKAWFALVLNEKGRWKEKYKKEKEEILKMEFKKFREFFMRIPAQLIQAGRKLIFRILCWNPMLHIFFRAVDSFCIPLRC